MNIDPNAPAFPVDGEKLHPDWRGLTIRAEIASRIMAGYRASDTAGAMDREYAVTNSIADADALIKALNKPAP